MTRAEGSSTPVGSGQFSGLSEAEARLRLKQDGPNELPRRETHGLLHTVIEVLREPMILLLLFAGGLYVFLGDHAEAILLLASIALIIGIELYQERRTENALEALRDLSSPRALVLRDGEHRRIAGREVVRDDLLVLGEGDRVPADAVLMWSTNLSIDESLLTGESVPVRKSARAVGDAVARPGGDDLPYVYSGTLVTSGQGIARVVATGAGTEMGRIGTALQTLGSERTRLQHETNRVVRLLATLALACCALVIVAYGLAQGSLVDGLLAGIALAMALIPEEFPVVLTVFLALGAWRIARSQVLTRRVPAIEALGAATVLCVDKTGTLTQNRMTVANLAVPGAEVQVDAKPLPSTVQRLVELGTLASEVDPFDPMERAIKQVYAQGLAADADGSPPGVLVKTYPLSDTLLAMTHVWQVHEQADYTVATKGAPEAIAQLCRLDETQRLQLTLQVERMATAGLRVLGVAEARAPQSSPLPEDQAAFAFTYVGLIGLADPIRPSVPQAVAFRRLQGLGVLLVTFGVLTWALFKGLPEQDARVLTFATLVIADLGLILANRARSGSIFTAFLPRNRALEFVVGGATILLVAVVAVPGLRQLFGFGVVHADDLAVIVGATLVALFWLEAMRLAFRRNPAPTS